jgi:uncharacterized protein YecE (DUF72 family)
VKQTSIFIGTSGWYYDHWENVLYPPGLAKSERFTVYASEFNSVEINATFYRFPSDTMVNGWNNKAPENFIYAVKANRIITHIRKLKNAEDALEKFIEAISPLGNKLGVVLFQLPPSLKQDTPLLKDFLTLLPHFPPSCFEFRHDSWECAETYDLLRKAGIGHVVVSKKDYPFNEVHTTRIAYYRLHGPEQMCASPYSEAWLQSLADRLVSLSHIGMNCFVFFNNDIGGHAVYNARSLKSFVYKKLGKVWTLR